VRQREREIKREREGERERQREREIKREREREKERERVCPVQMRIRCKSQRSMYPPMGDLFLLTCPPPLILNILLCSLVEQTM
jgi:hypothetical protein